MNSLLFPWVAVCMRKKCLPSKSGVSASPSLVNFLWSSPTGLQSQTLWGLLLLLPDPQAEELHLGLRTLIPVGKPLWYNYFSCLCVTHPGFDFITNAPHLPSHCGLLFVFGHSIWFLVDSSGFFCFVCQWFLSSCDFGVFMRGKKKLVLSCV